MRETANRWDRFPTTMGIAIVMSVVDDAFNTARAGLDFKKLIDRLRGAYLRRRGESLHELNSSWNASRIATQLKAELVVVQDYLTGKDSLINDTETGKTPSHLELQVEAALIVLSIDGGTFGQRFFDGILKEALANRATWIPQIVWRAVALHSKELWESLGPPPKLRKEALDEIVDRRLRAVEQMHFNVNSVGFGSLGRSWIVSGPTGPWVDGFRGRSFEYPWVQPADKFRPILSQMPDWRLDSSQTAAGLLSEVDFDPLNHVRVRIPGMATPAWRLAPTRNWINFHPIPVMEPADVIQEMFTPRSDFWDRSWLYCDQVGSLVNIEALWFATRRRTTNDDLFNTVMKRPDYIRLGPVVGNNYGILMADSPDPVNGDPFFENVEVDIDELQVGDFVRFWNSQIYEMLPPYTGAWGSEFSIVMGLDINGSSGKVPRPLSGGPQIWLAGHGIHTTLYNSMAAEATGYLNNRFLRARLVIASGTPSADKVIDEGHTYVRWTPYEAFDAPGAWWVEIPQSTWHDEWNYATLGDALNAVPRTVAKVDGGTGYQPPPDPDAIYFPISEPAVDQTDTDGDSWRAYLRRRKASPSFRLKSTALNPLAIDGRLAQGLFYRGSKAKIAVVRPRVRS